LQSDSLFSGSSGSSKTSLEPKVLKKSANEDFIVTEYQNAHQITLKHI